MDVQSIHLRAKLIQRSAGQSAVAAAAYRSGQALCDMRVQKIFDYTRRQEIIAAEILAPDGTPDWLTDRSRLWNEVERIEKRKDSQLAREIELSVPASLPADRREKLVWDFCTDNFVAEGMIADIALHGPGRGDNRNHHAHIMLTMRSIEADGFGKKVREWNENERLERWKVDWEAKCNRALEDARANVRVDRRSIEDRRQDALARAEAASDWIERRRCEIEAEALSYVPLPNIGRAAWKALQTGQDGDPRFAERIAAWKAARQSKVDAAARAARMAEELEAEIEVHQRQDIEDAARLLFNADRGEDARMAKILAVLVEDVDWDISPILDECLPELAEKSDLRGIMDAFRDADHSVQTNIEEALEADPKLEERVRETGNAVQLISDELHQDRKTWEQIERGLNRWVIRPVADAIRKAVAKLAELLGRERLHERSTEMIPNDTDGDGFAGQKEYEPPSQRKRSDPSHGM